MKLIPMLLTSSSLFCVTLSGSLNANELKPQTLSFAKAIRVAQQNDPWLTGNIEQQKSMESLSYASDTLPDPKISIGVGSLAADSLEFDQEPMSQFKVGITQMFPRGESLAIKSRKLKIESQQYPLQRQDRTAKIAVTVGSLWLDAYNVLQTMTLVEKNRELFEQLVDIAEANYSTAKGNARQQDVVRAQVELTRLEDRLIQLAQQKNRFQGQLLQWLSDYSNNNDTVTYTEKVNLDSLVLDTKIPQIDLLAEQIVYSESWLKQDQLVPFFVKHPAVLALDKKILASKTGVTLAKQKYQPEWGVTASYAYRDDDPMGNERSDLLSIGVTFDLPLFTENRQDQEVKSAVSQAEVIKTEKILLLRKMMSSFASGKGRLLTLEQRKSLFNDTLVPQVNEQIDSSLMAYTHDDGDFSDVIRARMALLNTEIDYLAINVEQQKLILELNYLFMKADVQSIYNFKTTNKVRFGGANDY